MAESSLVARRSIVKGRKDRNADRVAEMYAAYCGGASLSGVGKRFGVSRQAVFDVFRVRKLPLRKAERLPPVSFNGRLYTKKKDGYYRATEGGRNLMHRDVWEFHNGPIPSGHDIHHKDEDKSNNEIGNLECLPKPEHTRHHNPAIPHKAKPCKFCGNEIPRIRYANGALETPSRMRRKKFCNSACAHAWLRGKSRGSVA